MPIEIGQIEALYRFPVKSMRGESLDEAMMGWHGIEGDRRFAFRRLEARGGNPWLSGGRMPDLLSFTPLRKASDDPGLVSHVRTPDGAEMDLFGADLAAEIQRRHGAPVQMMRLDQGIFDAASISIIATSTVQEIGRVADRGMDVRRFRPNIVIRSNRDIAFEEDTWVGGVITFGDTADAPAVAVTMKDPRCSMVNIDPEGGPSAPEVMKACVTANENNAGIYCTVTKTGRLAVGQPILLQK